MNLFVYNKVFDVFSAMDKDHDRRITFAEFHVGAPKFDVSGDKETFDSIDTNLGGVILFDEFCAFYARRFNPILFATHDKQVAAKPKKAVAPAKKPVDDKADIHTAKCEEL